MKNRACKTSEILRIHIRRFSFNYPDNGKNGGEPIAAMGVDTPLAPISKQNPSLFEYFKQLFAQVTNPPIDSLREKIVTSTAVYIGTDGNILEEKAENCHMLRINNPILTNTDLLKIKNMNNEGLR